MMIRSKSDMIREIAAKDKTIAELREALISGRTVELLEELKKGCAALSDLAPCWQPIATAPKDGDVLIYVPDDDNGEVYKIARWTDLAAKPGWHYRGGWLASDAPTHWHALPEPPEPPCAHL